MKNIAKTISLGAVLCSSVLFATTAHAANGSAGKTAKGDVSLNGVHADAVDYAAGVNPQQGKGNSSGFAKDFALYGSKQGWTSIAAFGSTADNGVAISTSKLGTNLTFTFDNTDGRNGSWSVTNNDVKNNVKLDLVFAMHTGGGSSAWLFDDEILGAGAKTTGNWTLNALNPGGKASNYSNLTIFARDVGKTAFLVPTTPVPEPESYAMLLAGLGLIGFMSRRRKGEYDTFR
ncbi:PEP-CTERM sorting domain-containing protein [Massilia scottii]|uniref:PEP-CTERM sorting domain-containing protein n=1 Tax=Massilia scottii TaxID=3057166 RepID=UPI00279667E3|nr:MULTISPECIES: PEP-CTERM sorting domain-containing protein [unclassified Massilia]MDQ1813928.1 PEP-CTERM sorting domain-containing protein [Massilia sp. CCM 9210]MDQ1829482.1 PEP-CTERM sorting domain-containing protein [Massilia sp. CCM 9029]